MVGEFPGASRAALFSQRDGVAVEGTLRRDATAPWPLLGLEDE